MLRVLRAFAWMRWRVLMNSLEKTGARDTVERLSLAVEQIGPLIAICLLGPSMAGLAGLGAYAGYWLAGGGTVMVFEVLYMLLFGACVFSLIGPLLMPSIERTASVRLLLLPIPRNTLYVAQAASAISEPWVLLALPILFSIPLGLAAGGAFIAATLAFAAGILLGLILVHLSALSALLLQLVVRDRRRGELIALFFIILIPALSMLPGLLGAQRSREERFSDRTTRAERPDHTSDRARDEKLIQWVSQASRHAFAVAPSTLYASATRASVRAGFRGAGVPLLALVVSGVVLHALGALTLGRLLDSPASGPRRQATSAPVWSAALPGLTRGSAAVAQAQLRLAMRSPRGRSILLSPLIVFAVFAIVMRRSVDGLDLGFLQVTSGLGLATLGSTISLLSILPFATNQFAIDRAGLTLALLSPLATRDLLIGKAAGNALISVVPSQVCVILAYALFPEGPLALWFSIPPALLATYLLAAPGVAALSALFPRTVDLDSIGRRSNAHGAAGLLGLLVFVAATLPSALVAFVSIGVFRLPALAPLLMLAWCGLALVASRLALGAVAALVDKRRENLVMVAR
jgi:hypothetical protein